MSGERRPVRVVSTLLLILTPPLQLNVEYRANTSLGPMFQPLTALFATLVGGETRQCIWRCFPQPLRFGDTVNERNARSRPNVWDFRPAEQDDESPA